MDNDELTGLVFVDFHKAFDVLDHNLLLKKLSVYGARPDSVAWFQSYLAGWRQFVKLGHTPSQLKPVRQGLLQGSILCPFLFLLFVHDICLYIWTNPPWYICWRYHPVLAYKLKPYHFFNLKALSNDLENIKKWSTENKMYINTEKTKALFVTGKRLQYKLRMETESLQLHLNTTKYQPNIASQVTGFNHWQRS